MTTHEEPRTRWNFGRQNGHKETPSAAQRLAERQYQRMLKEEEDEMDRIERNQRPRTPWKIK